LRSCLKKEALKGIRERRRQKDALEEVTTTDPL